MTTTTRRWWNLIGWGLVLALALTMVVTPADAKRKGGGGSSATIAINEPAPYVFGQDITFATSGSRSNSPWVRVRCFQGGERVYTETNPVGGNAYVDDVFTLGPTRKWTGGDADCTAELGFYARNGRWRTEASMSFHVDG